MIDFIPPVENEQSKVESSTKIVDPPKKKQSRLRRLFGSSKSRSEQSSGSDVNLLKVDTVGKIPISPVPPTITPVKKLEQTPQRIVEDSSNETKFDVNLLPLSISFKSNKKILSAMMLWGIVSIILVTVVFMGLSIYSQRITEESLALEIEIQQLDSNINKYNELIGMAADWQVKLATVNDLLRTHIYWTNFFEVLESITLPSVYYKGFTASIINTDINLSSYASSFTEVARQLVAYQNFPDIFKQINVTEASLDEGIGVSYSAQASLQPSIFYDEEFINQE